MEGEKKLEKDIQREVLAYLATRHEIFFWRTNNIPVFARNNAGKMSFRALPKYTPRGLPDIMIVANGKFLAVEVKRPGVGLRPEQDTFRVSLEARGGYYYIVRSVEDMQKII